MPDMPEWKVIFGVAAVVASGFQYITYIIDILRGRTRPHAFSWFVWGVPAALIYAAQLIGGGGAGSWATAMTSVLCTTILVLSLFYGEKDISWLDWTCLVLALAAVAVWGLTKDPLGSVILITISDVIGVGPTLRKSIDKPYEETLNSYFVGGLKWLLALCALENFSLTVWLYPAVMMCLNWIVVSLLTYRRSKIKRPH